MQPSSTTQPNPSTRVLMIAACPFPTPQGTQVLIHQLAAHLHSPSTHVELLTYGFGRGDIQTHDSNVPYTIHRAPCVPFHTNTNAGPSWGRPAADALLTLKGLDILTQSRAQKRPFDLIHAHNYEGAIAGAILAKLHNLPLLYHSHTLMGHELETYFQSPRARSLARLFGLFLDSTVPPLADACISVSHDACSVLQQHTSSPVHYHPPAIDYGPHPSPDPSSPSFDTIYIGNSDGYQNLHTMLQALSTLRSGPLPSLSCAIVTAEPHSKWLPILHTHNLCDCVHLLPHTSFDDVKTILERSTVALLPRILSSGFPIKLLNYLASGRPTVACLSGAQHLTSHDGVITVPDDDADAMADAVAFLLQNPSESEKLGNRARKSAQNFTWHRSTHTLKQVYLEILRAWTHTTDRDPSLGRVHSEDGLPTSSNQHGCSL